MQYRRRVIIFDEYDCGELAGATIDTTDVDGYVHAIFMISGDQIPQQPDGQYYCTALIKSKLQGYPDVEENVELPCQLIR